MPDLHHCCCPNPCEYEIRVRLKRCPGKTGASTELYTFTFDGPSGEHQETTGYLDITGSLEAVYENPGAGSWTVEVSGPAGSCTLSATIVECKNQEFFIHAVHGTTWYDCSSTVSSLVGYAGYSVTGPGVGSPSSGTTAANGDWSVLIYEDGEYTFGLTPPSGTQWNPPSIEWTRTGQDCPPWVDVPRESIPAEGYRCACNNDCPHPVASNLLLTTKYGSHAISLTGEWATTGPLTVYDAEGREPIVCPNGFVYVREDGPGADVLVTYRLSCIDGSRLTDGKFSVVKTVHVLPSFQPDAYGNLYHVGYRMSVQQEDGFGSPHTGGISSGYSCHTVAGTASLPEIAYSKRRKIYAPCDFYWGAPNWDNFPTIKVIPGTDETVTISEAP